VKRAPKGVDPILVFENGKLVFVGKRAPKKASRKKASRKKASRKKASKKKASKKKASKA